MALKLRPPLAWIDLSCSLFRTQEHGRYTGKTKRPKERKVCRLLLSLHSQKRNSSSRGYRVSKAWVQSSKSKAYAAQSIIVVVVVVAVAVFIVKCQFFFSSFFSFRFFLLHPADRQSMKKSFDMTSDGSSSFGYRSISSLKTGCIAQDFPWNRSIPSSSEDV
jgi:hypothetical protein